MTTLNEIAATVRGRRQDLALSQAALAERAGVSRKWIYEFEAGKSTAELGLVLKVLDALDIDVSFAPRELAEPAAPSEATVALDVALTRARKGAPASKGLGGTTPAMSAAMARIGKQSISPDVAEAVARYGKQLISPDVAEAMASMGKQSISPNVAAAAELARLHGRPSATEALSRLNATPSQVTGDSVSKAQRKRSKKGKGS